MIQIRSLSDNLDHRPMPGFGSCFVCGNYPDRTWLIQDPKDVPYPDRCGMILRCQCGRVVKGNFPEIGRKWDNDEYDEFTEDD